MEILYWALEYSKVNIAYMTLVFLWPTLLFRKYLRGKSLTFRFGFCVTVSILLCNTLVLIFGLVGLLRVWFTRTLFYGSILVSAYLAIPDKRNTLKQAGRVIIGTYGIKQLLLEAQTAVNRRIKGAVHAFLNRIEGHKGEYVLLGIVLIYGMIYFTYGTFQTYSYGFGDMYPHTAWVYGLTQGQIFSAGVYPEGMHCFVYAMHSLFGIRLYSCMLFTEGVHILTFLLSAYCLFKEVFRSRYTPIMALTLFLTVDLMCVDEVYSMSRLQWTIPQEFGFYTLFLCAAFLARYLKAPKHELEFLRYTANPILKWMKKWFYNEDLLIFMTALASSLAIHFYPTIMAFFLCLAFVPMAIHKVVQPTRLIPLATAVIAGFMVAVIPMALALASGIPFQGSIGWAVNVMNGTDSDEPGGAVILDETTGEAITGDLSSLFRKKQENPDGNDPETDGAKNGDGTGGNSGGTEGNSTGNDDSTGGNGAGNGDSVGGNGAGNGEDTRENDAGNRDSEDNATDVGGTGTVDTGNGDGGQKASLGERLWEKVLGIYWYAYVTLYAQKRAAFLVKMTVLAFMLFLAGKVGCLIYRLATRKKVRLDGFDGYFALAVGSIFFMTIYAAEGIGLPALIAGSRLCSVSQLLLMGVCAVPIDFALFFLECYNHGNGMTKLSYALVFMIYVGTMMFDCFHGYLYFELTRYNSAVDVTESITRRMPQYSYTIVSTVDELYQLIQYGFHEEAVQFINDVVDNDYTLPTEYVFVYVEKHPIEYAQSHFFDGPGWLAWEKYPTYYASMVSEGKHINNGTISRELAETPFYQYPISSKAYSELATRMVVESRMKKWCDEFGRLYPGEIHTYYEDDDLICYYFRQNPACLYQLGIQ